jgi:thiamine pyrophosphate-dependent acetolactate synthase large subunit-like protein
VRRVDLARLSATKMPPNSTVVCGLGSTSRAWREIGDPRPSYYASDPMGLASSIALGLALADQSRPTTLLQGDGDLLMSLGALVTTATATPDNLRTIVFHNRIYETGGRRPLPVGDDFDLAGIAGAAGLDPVLAPPTDAKVDEALTVLFAASGPGLVVVLVDPEESPYGAPPKWSQAEERAFFIQAREASS